MAENSYRRQECRFVSEPPRLAAAEQNFRGDRGRARRSIHPYLTWRSGSIDGPNGFVELLQRAAGPSSAWANIHSGRRPAWRRTGCFIGGGVLETTLLRRSA